TILSHDEAMALPPKERPLNYRISSEVYHAIFEKIGAASMCWNPLPSDQVFDSSAAEKLAVELCFVVADDMDKKNQAIEELAALARQKHYNCEEDTFYGCPLSRSGCTDDRQEPGKCNC